MVHLLHLIFRCDGDVMENLVFVGGFWSKRGQKNDLQRLPVGPLKTCRYTLPEILSYQTPETPGWTGSMDRRQGHSTARSIDWFESMHRVHLKSVWNPSPRFSLLSRLPPIKMQSGRGWSPPGQNQLPKSKIETGTNPTKSSELLYPCPCANLSNMFIGK